MSSRPELRLDWCSHEAAKYAVEKWHYSRCIPKSKLVKIGVWENQKFIGVVIFGLGATSKLVSPYGLQQTEGCELVRVALSKHDTPVSRIVSIAIRLLKKQSPGLRLIVSFADPEQNHHGGIYKAGGWIYAGKSSCAQEFVVLGKRWHGRSLRNGKPKEMTTLEYAKKLDPSFRVIMGSSKHRYLMPLDREMRTRISHLSRPYPKRAGSAASGTTDFQSVGGGATPTPALSQTDGSDDAST